MKNRLLEVCCGSVDDAVEAQRGGADRVELNSNIMYGGLTPTIGAVKEAKRVLDIPVMVMIRPRGGGFCYTEREMSTMLYDTEAALDSGADGIVFGILNPDGTIDMERCEKIVSLCRDKDIVFHRAIDVVPDLYKGLDQLVELGVHRVLTTGQAPTVIEGVDEIRKMIDYAGDKIQIMPGGGTPWNADTVLKVTGCDQLHMAAFTNRFDTSTQHNPYIFYGMSLYPPEDRYEITDASVVSKVRGHVK